MTGAASDLSGGAPVRAGTALALSRGALVLAGAVFLRAGAFPEGAGGAPGFI